MNRTQLEANFSVDRLSRYFNHYPDNETKAIYLYKANIALSEALYTALSILEVALRNKINVQLIRKYGRVDWYVEWYKHPIMRYAWPEINNAIKHLHEESKPIKADKIIASLMFGFWTSLFMIGMKENYGQTCALYFLICPKLLGKEVIYQHH